MTSKKLSISHLIFSLTFLTIALTLISSLFSGFNVARETLTKNALGNNQFYAKKMAVTADSYIKDTLSMLQYSADYIGTVFDSKEAILEEAQRIYDQTDRFNSVVILDKEFKILSEARENKNKQSLVYLQTNTTMEAMEAQKAYISDPFLSVYGKQAIFFSQPIFNEHNDFLGIVGGTLFLKEDNSLKQILADHHYNGSTSLYVVDQNSYVLFHDDQLQILDNATDNVAVKNALSQKTGSTITTNKDGTEMIVGYSFLFSTGWGIISQQPLSEIEKPTWGFMSQVFKTSSPFLLLSIIISIAIGLYITKPLRKLAILTGKSSDEKAIASEIEAINSWYYEVEKMKGAVLKSIGSFNQQVSYYHNQSIIDPLTGLSNRRAMNSILHEWIEKDESFSVLLLDLDYFKSVNDNYGHLIGDEVLQYVAEIITEHLGPNDIASRYGGEEFVILFKDKPLPYITNLAENLRSELENSISPTGEPVTMSAGICAFPLHTNHPEKVLDFADYALYQSKKKGRNQVTVYQE